MAILSNLLSIAEPSGFWITIIKAFEAVTNNYVLAIIFLTVVIRLIWGIVDTFTKFAQQKSNAIQVKMKPELDRVKEKYANQPQVLQQKQNEIQKRYMGRGYYGSCLIMLLTMVFNTVIFFTLFAGLNAMGAYKTGVNYDNLKYTYANCMVVTDKYFDGAYDDPTKYQVFENYQNLEFEIVEVEGVKTINLIQTIDEERIVLASNEYKNDFGYTIPSEVEGEEDTVISSNAYIVSVLDKIFPVYAEGEEIGSKEIIIKTTPVVGEDGQPVLDENGDAKVEKLYLSTAIQNVAMRKVEQTYELNKDSFLWIENIWLADSPFEQSIVDYRTLESQIGKNNVGEKEEQIYNAFMIDLKEAKSRVNGYYILPLLCVISAIFTMYITKLYNYFKNKRKGLPIVKEAL